MLTIFQIANMPSVVDHRHESLYRSYHVLALVTELLRANVPSSVIVRLIEEIDEEGRGLDEIRRQECAE